MRIILSAEIAGSDSDAEVTAVLEEFRLQHNAAFNTENGKLTAEVKNGAAAGYECERAWRLAVTAVLYTGYMFSKWTNDVYRYAGSVV